MHRSVVTVTVRKSVQALDFPLLVESTTTPEPMMFHNFADREQRSESLSSCASDESKGEIEWDHLRCLVSAQWPYITFSIGRECFSL